MRASLISLIVGWSVLSTTVALAQAPQDADTAKVDPNVTRAASLRAEGEKLYAEGRIEDAAARLRSSFNAHKDPVVAVLLARCEMKLSRMPDAATHLAYALRELPEGKERTDAQRDFDEVAAKVAAVKVVVNVEGATVIAGSQVFETPLEGELYVEPGVVAFTARKSGYKETRKNVELPAGKVVQVDIVLQKGASLASDGGHRSKEWSMIPAYVIGGFGLAALGAGIGLRLSGDGKGSDAQAILDGLIADHGSTPCDPDPDTGEALPACATLKSLRQDHDTFVNASTSLFVVGGLAVAGAITYGILARRTMRPKDSARASQGPDVMVVPVGSHKGGGVLIQGSF